MMIDKSISLIFPMYNEKECLPVAISTAKSVLETLTPDYEIIIVDDASVDGSGQMADNLSRADNRIKVIHHNKNRKLGGALKTGFYSAAKDIIIYTDIDLPFDLAQLKEALPLISGSDIVIGSRIGRRESMLRVFYSWGYNNLINLVFRLGIKDVNFALKIFKREILNDMQLKSEGSFINAEFLAKAKKLGFSIREVNIKYNPRTYGVSRLSTPSVIAKVLYEIVRFYAEISLFSEKAAAYGKVRKLYNKVNFSARVYNFIRFKTCPFDRIEKFIPEEGDVVDLGCGTALLLNLLSLKSDKRKLSGFDMDKRKIRIAKESVKNRKNIEIEKKDISSGDFRPPKASCVVITDVLYYLNFAGKKQLLEKIYNALEPEGLLIIKDMERAFSLRYLWVFLQEFLAVRIFGLTLADGLYFTGKRDYLSLFKECKFIADVFDLSRGYLYPHILYACRKE